MRHILYKPSKTKECENTRDLRPSGVLRSVDWYSVTDVSGQPIGFIFKVQAVPVFVTFYIISIILTNKCTQSSSDSQ
jgi:hypothetical protein